MKHLFNVLALGIGLFFFNACSDDNVNDFRPVPYPDEVVGLNPDPDFEPIWEIASPTITVFSSKASNDISYRVPAIAVTKKGSILVFCEARYGTWQDKAGRTDILMKRSTDKGITWTEKNLTNQATSSKLS